jgi:CRISPR system Cascade subunit CasE
VSLYLYSFQPDLPRLMRLAAREQLLPPGDDPGYAIHAVFAASFGKNLSPKPWALLAPGQGGGPRGRLLAYGERPLVELRAHAAAFADPAFAAPLALDGAADRLMPFGFEAGTRLGFRVRVRPVARTGRPIAGHSSAMERGDRARERDVYLARVTAAERKLVSAGMGNGADGDQPVVPSRAECYLEWLDDRLADIGASIERSTSGPHAGGGALAARVDGFRLTRILTRDRHGGVSRHHSTEGPDALVTGVLIVKDAERFGVGLARGVGRLRAFGFGMLLLSPPQGPALR